MKKAFLYMSLGATMAALAFVYMQRKDDINYNMKKIIKHPEESIAWIKKNI